MSKSIPSNSLEAAIRTHFGLTQAELARYLGITRGQVAHLEAGRRLPSRAINNLLQPLAELLPPPEGRGPVAPSFLTKTAPPPDLSSALLAALPDFEPLFPPPLRKRLRETASQAAALRWQFHRETKRNALQNRRQWALAVLQASLPLFLLTPAERLRLERWLQLFAADVTATALHPSTLAAHALAVLRLLVLEAESTALRQLLNGA